MSREKNTRYGVLLKPFGGEPDRKLWQRDKGHQRRDCHYRQPTEGVLLPTIPKCAGHGIEKVKREIGKGGKDHRGLPIQIKHIWSKSCVDDFRRSSQARFIP